MSERRKQYCARHRLRRILKDFMPCDGHGTWNLKILKLQYFLILPGQSSRQPAWEFRHGSLYSTTCSQDSFWNHVKRTAKCSARTRSEDGTQGMKAVDHRHQVLPELGSFRENDQSMEPPNLELYGYVPVWLIIYPSISTLMSSNAPNRVLKITEEPVGLICLISLHVISIRLHAPRGFQGLSSSSCA